MDLSKYIKNIYSKFIYAKQFENPWDIITNLSQIIESIQSQLPKSEFKIKNGIAIHHLAIIENNVSLKKNTIIGEKSIIKSGAYLRSGVFIGKGVTIGTNCEIKQSIIFDKSRVAHLNYIGNSILGEDVNIEAGAILANHYNEKKNKKIQVVVNNSIIDTSVTKFGSLIGDHSKIGANSVLNPGTILESNSIVGRLVHVHQLLQKN
jgi:NDP-sugar pyrophosphorylase family protein